MLAGPRGNPQLRERKGARFRAKELFLVISDDGTQPQTLIDDIEALLTSSLDISTSRTALPNAHEPNTGLLDAGAPKMPLLNTTTDSLAPLTPREETQHRGHTYVSQDPRYALRSSEGDAECREAPTRILEIEIEIYPL